MNVSIGLNATSVCLKHFKLINFNFGDLHPKHDKVWTILQLLKCKISLQMHWTFEY